MGSRQISFIGGACWGEPVVGNSEVKKLEERVRELERILGRKTLKAEILRKAPSKAQSKADLATDVVA